MLGKTNSPMRLKILFTSGICTCFMFLLAFALLLFGLVSFTTTGYYMHFNLALYFFISRFWQTTLSTRFSSSELIGCRSAIEATVIANSRHCDCVDQRIASDSKKQVIIVQEPSSSRRTTSVEACAATQLQQGLVTG